MDTNTPINIKEVSHEDRAKGTTYPPDIKFREAEGAAGKLYSIEILFCQYNSKSVYRKHTIRNLTAGELMKWRENVFSSGLLLPVDPNHWTVIRPGDILSIDVWRQKMLFT